MLLVLIFHYNISIKILISDFFGIKKFRVKKLDSSFYDISKNNKTGVNLTNSYKLFFIKSKIVYLFFNNIMKIKNKIKKKVFFLLFFYLIIN